MAVRAPLTALQLAALAPRLVPSFVNGHWRAALPARRVVRLKKEAAALGLEWPAPAQASAQTQERIAAPAAAAKQGRHPFDRTPKGHLHEKAKPEREAKIQSMLKKMPEMIAKMRAEKQAARLKQREGARG
eukprot:TRINITY_DN7869_c0_g1_i1.p2 TRINITY_DN7869_c0_g1~~TRINITY_DN7869_c0_g1_i1.p2  ORF type:complete len:131 (-),score=38.56 TRINITY_DN7869_c0_g1_i1:19-411(-)